jgi:hypothetical protein
VGNCAVRRSRVAPSVTASVLQDRSDLARRLAGWVERFSPGAGQGMKKVLMETKRRLVALAVLALLLVGEATPALAQSYDTTGAPEELPYRAGEPVPLGYHLEQSPRGDTVAAGSVLFGLSYGVAVAVGASDGFQNKKGYLLLPLLGPLLTATTRKGTRPGTVNLAVIFEAATDIALQGYGLGLVLREELRPRPRLLRDAKLRLSVSPELARDFLGFSLTGEL